MHRFREGSRKQDCRHKNNPKHSNQILSVFISVSVPTIASQTATDYKLSIKKNNTQDWKHLYLWRVRGFTLGVVTSRKQSKLECRSLPEREVDDDDTPAATLPPRPSAAVGTSLATAPAALLSTPLVPPPSSPSVPPLFPASTLLHFIYVILGG
jgi:hypothetical protein